MKIWMLHICLAIALLIGCGSPVDIRVGEIAPAFRLQSLNGTWVQSQSLTGRVVVLNFWQTTCGPCLKELPHLKALAAKSGASVIGINLSEDPSQTVKPFVEQHRISYPILLGDETVFQQFDGTAIPYTLILDPTFKIVRIYRGPVDQITLEQAVKTILQDS